MKYALAILLVAGTILISCKNEPATNPSEADIADNSSTQQLSAQTIQKHLAELSSDAYQGRMPCTEGGIKTYKYLESEMKNLGLKPTNGDSYLQAVPLLTVESEIRPQMKIDYGNKQLTWNKGKDFIIHSERTDAAVALANSELVFCGYGIVDEKKGWNDYAGMDMKGKTAVILINDPGYGGDDPEFFNGDIMTYAGRWDYKYDTVDKMGADGLLIIHETSSAGYPWFVIQSSWTGPQQGLSGVDRSQDCGIKGWIHLDKAVELFTQAGLDFTTEIKAARKPGFKPKSLGAKVTMGVDNDHQECISYNVAGYIPGAKYPDEYIVYTAHWDHIGIGKVVDGDSIYNGALDNASGVSTLLAMAEGFKSAPTPPERSVVFLLVTAEEQGLLGSEYYVENPLFPLEKTVCNLNMDGVNPIGEMKDLTITGKGHSEMDDIAETAAKKQNRYVIAEQEPEKGYFFRSDHFNFAKKGVPALYAEGSFDHKTKGKEFVKEFRDNFIEQRYHAPADEYDPAEWIMEGMLQDGALYFDIGLTLANSRTWPKWYPQSEFSRKKS